MPFSPRRLSWSTWQFSPPPFLCFLFLDLLLPIFELIDFILFFSVSLVSPFFLNNLLDFYPLNLSFKKFCYQILIFKLLTSQLWVAWGKGMLSFPFHGCNVFYHLTNGDNYIYIFFFPCINPVFSNFLSSYLRLCPFSAWRLFCEVWWPYVLCLRTRHLKAVFFFF